MAGSSGSLVLTFEIFNGGEFVRREELSAESVTIGKGPAAMLRIEDPALQDLHAVLNVNEDGSVQLLDLVGDQSTLVNGAPVSNVVLANGEGTLELVARISDAVPLGVLMSPKGRWPGREASGANVNVLNPGAKSDMGDATAVHGVEVQLRAL